MTPEEFSSRAAAAVATVEPDETSYLWLTRNVARRSTRRRLGLAVAAAGTVAVTGVAVAVVPRALESRPTPPAAPPGAIDGDVDGDGAVDRVDLVRRGTDRALAWGVRVHLSSGATVTAWRPPGSDTRDTQTVSGVVDANRDGRAEVVVRAGANPMYVRYYMLTLLGSSLEWVRRPDSGDEPQWLISTHEGHGGINGWGCAGSEIYTVGAGAGGGGQRSWYALSGATLVYTRGEILPSSPRREPVRTVYEGVRCGSIRIVGT